MFSSPVTDSRDFGGTEMLVGAGVRYSPSGHLGFGKTLVSHALMKWFLSGQASLCTKCSGIISESLFPPPPAGNRSGRFSDLHCDHPVGLLEVRLTEVWGSR